MSMQNLFLKTGFLFPHLSTRARMKISFLCQILSKIQVLPKKKLYVFVNFSRKRKIRFSNIFRKTMLTNHFVLTLISLYLHPRHTNCKQAHQTGWAELPARRKSAKIAQRIRQKKYFREKKKRLKNILGRVFFYLLGDL